MLQKKPLSSVVLLIGLTIVACNNETTSNESPYFTLFPAKKEANFEKEEPFDRQDSGGESRSSNLGLESLNNKNIILRTEKHLLEEIGTGTSQIQAVCREQTENANKVIQAFCINKVKPKSLVELQKALNLAIINPTLIKREENGTGGNPAFAALGHSTSLVGRSVSALNPRVILFTPPDLILPSNPDFVAMSFVRGEQLVELVAFDRQSRSLEFYLLSFTQECNRSNQGCKPGDLLSPEIEQNWEGVTLYSMRQLQNTALDCLHCHQPQGPSSPRSLRMQELASPWSHWFSNDTKGLSLINDYYAMHGKGEAYAGVPGKMIGASSPALLERLIIKSGLNSAQIIDYNSSAIELQITANNPKQPVDNSVPGVSDAWKIQYENTKPSLLPPIPYHDLKITEFSAANNAVNFYQMYQQGKIPAKNLPDFSDIFKLNHNERAKMGFAVEREALPTEILARACGQCHNSRLDQNLSRARFNVDFDSIVDRNEVLDEAIRRVQLGYSAEKLKSLNVKFYSKQKYRVNQDENDQNDTEIREVAQSAHIDTMPPKRFRQLTDEQIDALIALFISKKI